MCLRARGPFALVFFWVQEVNEVVCADLPWSNLGYGMLRVCAANGVNVFSGCTGLILGLGGSCRVLRALCAAGVSLFACLYCRPVCCDRSCAC